jgi:hypothetical protein
MARAYEDDLRRKIFEAHGKGHGSFRTLAAVFGVSLGYVEKIFRQRQASAYWGDRLPSHPAEVLVTLIGSGFMIAAHRTNHTFCRDCSCSRPR